MDFVILGDETINDDPGVRRHDIDIDLVRFDSDEHVANRDLVTLVHHPLQYDHLVDRLTEAGQ